MLVSLQSTSLKYALLTNETHTHSLTHTDVQKKMMRNGMKIKDCQHTDH